MDSHNRALLAEALLVAQERERKAAAPPPTPVTRRRVVAMAPLVPSEVRYVTANVPERASKEQTRHIVEECRRKGEALPGKGTPAKVIDDEPHGEWYATQAEPFIVPAHWLEIGRGL